MPFVGISICRYQKVFFYMNNQSFVAVVSSFILIFITACQNPPSSLPHILLINVDDFGYMDSQIYGNQDIETPNMMRLARMGLVFTQAYASAANCAPSRASLMTGQYNPKHGVYTVLSSERGATKDRRLIPTPNTPYLSDTIVTMARAFKELGYFTVNIGKYHLGQDPLKQGFDLNIGGNHQGHPKSYFSPYHNPNLSDGPVGEYLTDRLTNEAMSLITTADQPLFLYLPYYAVHTPLQGKSDLVFKYKDRGMKDKTAHYAAMVENLDRNLGRLMDALTSHNLWQNTLVVFTSDNGGIAEVHSQSPLRAGKGSYYEGGTKVPLIFVWPNHITANTKSDQLTINLDLFPTLLGLIDQSLPFDYEFDGEDLSNVVLGKRASFDRNLFWHFPIYLQAYAGVKDEARDSLFRTRPGSTMLSNSWKLHQYFEFDEYELYNLEQDPSEQENVIQKYPQVADSLIDLLSQWQHKFNAPIPKDLNPNYAPH